VKHTENQRLEQLQRKSPREELELYKQTGTKLGQFFSVHSNLKWSDNAYLFHALHNPVSECNPLHKLTGTYFNYNSEKTLDISDT
jgi:hypothetical protein